MSADQIKSLIPSLLNQPDSSAWQELQEGSTFFGSANLRTFPVSLAMLEQRTGLTGESLGLLEGDDVNLDDFKYATLGVTLGSGVLGIMALALLPPNVGATVCYFVALVPILFLGIGSTAPGIIAGAIKSLKGIDDPSAGLSQRERMCRHEAAHLCCGYWCGLPIAAYQVDNDSAQVEFAAPSQQYSATQVAALAITGLAGSVAEALKWGKAIGATQDLMQVETVFRKAKDFYGATAQQDVTRWAAFSAAQLLRQYEAKYEKVVAAMERSAPLEECISILEEA